jgi:hypothetical protein
VRAVTTHEEAGNHPIRPVRSLHVHGHRGVVLAHPGHLVSAADIHTEFADAFVE